MSTTVEWREATEHCPDEEECRDTKARAEDELVPDARGLRLSITLTERSDVCERRYEIESNRVC